MVDELVANLRLSIKEIISKVGNDPNKRRHHLQWYNLYGSNPSESNSFSKEQNEDIEKATTFKGRVLIEVSCINMDNPMLAINDIVPITDKDAPGYEEYQGFTERLAQMKTK